MAVSPEAGPIRWRSSGLCSSSFRLPHAASFCHGPLEEPSEGTTGPPQRQEGGPEDRRSEEAWVFMTFFSDITEFAGALPLPATCGSAQSPCRTFHALKIPIVSLSAWIVFLTTGGPLFLHSTSISWSPTIC